VIDFGALNVGDPACELLPAWNLSAAGSRERFRTELEVRDAAWLRGAPWRSSRRWRRSRTTTGNYWDTNPGMVRQAAHALAQVTADLGG
jgi:aminoglycoside phosphotransferase (APT) family kinase protein